MPHTHFQGLIAATFTPMRENGAIWTEQVPTLVEHLIQSGCAGLYVCGSTGEGMSLTSPERREMAEAFVGAAAGRVPVIIQVGHNSLAEACDLAEHARSIGAAAVSATCPSYFPVTSVAQLIACMKQLASAAADTPFYYYHIPRLTGAAIDMPDFLRRAGDDIPNLAGIKYSEPTLQTYLACLNIERGRYDIMWGVDEMLLAALATGATSAIGSTYNLAAPLYLRIIHAVERGDLEAARKLQSRSVDMVRTLLAFPFHAAMKASLKMIGVDCGPCRLPLCELTEEDESHLRRQLTSIGFFEYCQPSISAPEALAKQAVVDATRRK